MLMVAFSPEVNGSAMWRSISATAPAKAILLGEHAVNRGQAALAVSVGLYATCTLHYQDDTPSSENDQAISHAACDTDDNYYFEAAEQEQIASRYSIVELGRRIDEYRSNNEYSAIQALAANDFFAATKYVLAALGNDLPRSMRIHFSSEIPSCAGLGSGGAIFVALAAALSALHPKKPDARQIADWAIRGDIVAHGGTASGLDTQTSLYGHAIRYTLEHQGEPVSYAEGLRLVIGNTHVFAATSQVNGHVREWLAAQPARMHYFHEIGLLVRHAESALHTGDWTELGRLLNLNQLVLERIGVSCPELEALNEAALSAGALGAKLSGSGGGGIMIALVTAEKVTDVAQAIIRAGGTALVAPIGVAGVKVQEGETKK